MSSSIIDDKYRVLRRLGAGGMGSVFEAQHTGTGRRVAIKVMSAALTAQDEMLVRFQREARALGAIETQHIVQVFDLGVDRTSGDPYMAMELLSGTDLDGHIKRNGPLPPELALRIVAQACLGLQKAHEAGIVHRDIKPANIFMAERDGGEIVVKLLDFGIARIRKDDPAAAAAGDLTQTGAAIGSPFYMSPEQAKGLRSLDHRSDIWSLGVVLYRALCGKTPHHIHQSMAPLIVAICTEPAPPVQDLAPWVPPEVAAIAHRALQLNPADRFSSAQEMLAAIQPLLPGGWSLRREAFIPVPEQERLRVAPRLQTAGRPPMPSATAPALAASTRLSAPNVPSVGSSTRAARMRAAVIALAGGFTIALVAIALFVFRNSSQGTVARAHSARLGALTTVASVGPETAGQAPTDPPVAAQAANAPSGKPDASASMNKSSSPSPSAQQRPTSPSISPKTSGNGKAPAPKASADLGIRTEL